MNAPVTHTEFAAAAGRIETLLSDRKPRLSTNRAAVGEAFDAAVTALGMTAPPGHPLADDAAGAAALEQLAAASGFLVRAVPVSACKRGETAVPVIAFAGADGEPVLIGGRGKGWSIASRQTGWVARTVRQLDPGAYDATGYMILPALPDGVIGLRQLLGFGLGRNVRELAGFLVATLLAGMIAALIPVVSQPLFDVIVPEHDAWLLGQISIFLVIVAAANLMTRFAAGLARLRFDGRTGFLLRAAAIDRALRIADRLAENNQPIPSAPIAALSARSVETWYRGIWGLGLTVVTSVLIAAPSLLVMAQVSARGAAVVALVFVACFGLAGWIAKRRIAALMNGLSAPQSWMTTAYEALALIDTIRAGAAEGRVFARWADGFLSLRHRFLRADRIGSGSASIESGFESLLILSAMLALVLAGAIATGSTTIAFVVATGSVAGAATTVIGSLGQVTMLALQHRMIAPILQGVPQPRSGHIELPPLVGAIELIRIGCYMGDAEAPVLEDVSIAIAPGEHIGIAGPSGAGKTTLLKVLLGLVRPQSGHVLFDGRDLAGLDAAALRRQIGVVGQGGRLFPGTLLDNITAGAPLTSDAAMMAVRLAGLEADIAALPLGLSTPVGDTDCGFSGGQVQRLLLARAFATRPKVLVLDEATSALDPKLESDIAAAIDGMQATTISVAHRLDTLQACDRIYVFDQGRIVESGSFAELAAGRGLFAAMRTAEGSLPDLVPQAANPVHAAIETVQAAFT